MKKHSKLFVIPVLTAALSCSLVACGEPETITETVYGPTVSGVTLSVGEGAEFGRVGVSHKLEYTATEGSEVNVALKKDGAAAPSSDYTYTPNTNSYVFKTTGKYTVTVTATKDGRSYEGSVSVKITESAVPQVEIPLTAITVNTPMTLYNASYAHDRQSETVDVYYRASQDAAYGEKATIDTDYKLVGSKFTALHGTGFYKVVVTATCSENVSTVKEAEIAARETPEAVTVSGSSDVIRIIKNDTKRFDYTVEGDASEYDVSFDSDCGLSGEHVGVGCMEVTAGGEPNFGHLTVTYTHKSVASAKYSHTFSVQTVNDLNLTPSFGVDPFDGTPDTIIPSAGLMLYNEAYAPDGVTKLGAADIKYEIADTTNDIAVEPTGTDKGACIKYVNGDHAMPYLVVQDYNDNNKTGAVTVKMTATYKGHSAVAYKQFELVDKTPDEYGKALNLGDADFSNMSTMIRENTVFTKNGFIVHRTNGNWGYSGATILKLPVGGSENFTVDYKFTIIGKNSVGSSHDRVSMNVGFFNVDKTTDGGYANHFALKRETDTAAKLDAYAWIKGTSTKSYEGNNIPSVDDGTSFYVRVNRKRTSNIIEYSMQWSPTGADGSYVTMYSCDGTVATGSANGCAPIDYVNFGYEFGCFQIENVRLTK